ncbi:hypothetical protein ACQP1K_19790 [Sphaerimonospora sp. CA-214678]|uniref:hypothetical protein n=1 Tax=Sphaerimonospora sp. CA-214678 TaxID=3240029 RepID=UPI003D8A40EC
MTPPALLLSLFALCLYGILCVAEPAGAASHVRHDRGTGAVGIRLLEAPRSRLSDPRARVFIVDHVNPGTTFTRRLEVSSSSAKPRHVDVYAGAAAIDGGTFTFSPGREHNELTSWIRLDRSGIDLPPHGSATVTATISVPGSATRGERYAVIWAQASSGRPGPERNVSLVNRVGVRAYLDVGPGGEPPSEFRVGEVLPRRLPDGRPLVTASVRNTGERAIDLEGHLSLTDEDASLRAGPYPISRGTTLPPGVTGLVSVPLDPRFPGGPWTFRLTLRSGHITRTVSGTFAFPAKPGDTGRPAALDSPSALISRLVAVVTLTGLVALVLVAYRRRRPVPF